jgi:hypothetical protein
VSKGISLEDLARASEEGVVSFSWFDGVLPPPPQLRSVLVLLTSPAGIFTNFVREMGSRTGSVAEADPRE